MRTVLKISGLSILAAMLILDRPGGRGAGDDG